MPPKLRTKAQVPTMRGAPKYETKEDNATIPLIHADQMRPPMRCSSFGRSPLSISRRNQAQLLSRSSQVFICAGGKSVRRTEDRYTGLHTQKPVPMLVLTHENVMPSPLSSKPLLLCPGGSFLSNEVWILQGPRNRPRRRRAIRCRQGPTMRSGCCCRRAGCF